MKITLVRHGQTIENANRIVQGQLDGTLSELGKQQAIETAEKLRNTKFDYIYCSDLGRCKQTAKEIIKFHQKTPIQYSSELREMNFGDFQGAPSRDYLWDELPGNFETRRAPNGENGLEFQKRVIDYTNNLLEEHPDDSMLLITHGGVMKILKSHIEKLDYEATIKSECANCEIWEYNLDVPLEFEL